MIESEKNPKTKTTEKQQKDKKPKKYALVWDGTELGKLEPSDV